MTTGATVTYLVAGAGMAPGPVLLDAAANMVAGDGPMHLCRRVAESAPPSGLPVAPPPGRGRIVDETWTAPLGWLQSALDSGVGEPLASRVVVRMAWPLGAVAETMLLLARLSCPSVRIALDVDPSGVDDVFSYMNRLGFPWIAVPPAGPRVSDIAHALARLGRRWLFDPQTQVVMEPLLHALPTIMGRALGRDPVQWRYRAVDALTGDVATGIWSASVHAMLRAGAPISSLGPVAALDAAWIDDLVEACASLDLDALREVMDGVNLVGGPR